MLLYWWAFTKTTTFVETMSEQKDDKSESR